MLLVVSPVLRFAYVVNVLALLKSSRFTHASLLMQAF